MKGNFFPHVLAFFSNLDQGMCFFWSIRGWTITQWPSKIIGTNMGALYMWKELLTQLMWEGKIT
jgi:hypothetical protein